jgi:ABC-type spermidine/putrescine transport system permease subunit II
MDGIDARLDSQQQHRVSNGYFRWFTQALKSAWSAAVATTIFVVALVVLQAGLIALAAGFATVTRSFSPAF